MTTSSPTPGTPIHQPLDLRAHVTQDAAYDAALQQLSVLTRTPVIQAAQDAVLRARQSNAARGQRVVHEWPDLHNSAVTALQAVQAAMQAAPASFPAAFPAAPVAAAPVQAAAPAFVAAPNTTTAVPLGSHGALDAATARNALAPPVAPVQAIQALPMGALPVLGMSVATPAAAPSGVTPLAPTRPVLWRVTRTPGGDRVQIFRNPNDGVKPEIMLAEVPLPAGGPPTKPSMLSWGPTIREALLFLFRGMLTGPGAPLSLLLHYCGDAEEAEICQRDLADLVQAGLVITEFGYFRLSDRGFEAMNTQRVAKLDQMRNDAARAQEVLAARDIAASVAAAPLPTEPTLEEKLAAARALLAEHAPEAGLHDSSGNGVAS